MTAAIGVEVASRGWRPRLPEGGVRVDPEASATSLVATVGQIAAKGLLGATLLVLLLGAAAVFGVQDLTAAVLVGVLLAGCVIRVGRALVVSRWQRRHGLVLLRVGQGPGFSLADVVARSADDPEPRVA